MERETLSVTGMSCETCEQTVEHALQTIDGVSRVDAHHDGDTVDVVVADAVTDEELHAAVEQAGFDLAV